MNAPAEKAALRAWLCLGLGLTLLAWIAWRVLMPGVAGHLSGDVRDVSAGESAARAAIRSAPLESRGYRMLALQAEARGELATAEVMFELAASRGPRDLASRSWLTNRALAAGEYPKALRHIDQMLRVQPEMSRQLFPVLLAFSVSAPIQADLAKVLLQSPPWRSDLMPQLIAESKDSGALFGLVERLRQAPGGLTKSELAAWIDRLTRDRHWGTAYLTWVDSLEPEARANIGNVFNGSFEIEPSQMGFDWRVDRVPGARVSREQVTGADDRLALRVGFEDRRVPFQHVRQLLALAPGAYHLRGKVRLDDLRTERGLVWTVTCAEDNRAIAETEPMTGRHDWKGFEIGLVVPAESCGGQWLTLRVPARIPAEQLIGGAAWFDGLQISAVAQ